MEIFEKNYEYFKNHFDEIVKGKIGKFVVIYNQKVFGYFDSTQLAVEKMQSKGIKIGDFIVQECTQNINDIMAVYYSASTI